MNCTGTIHFVFVTDHKIKSLLFSLLRRFVWNFFRLENEHLNNCGKFRAVRDISVAPMESSDQLQILRMMDDENGVVNRHVKKRLIPSIGKEKEDDRQPILEDISGKKL